MRMRIRQAISRRTIPIGAILAMAAATVVLTATPALADVANGFNGGGDTITVVSTTFSTTTQYLVQFKPVSACTPGAPVFSGGAIGTVATATSATALPVKVPPAVIVSSGRSTLYNLCIWDLASSGALAAYTPMSYTANIFDLALTPVTGPNGGGNTITGAMKLSGVSIPVPAGAGYPVQFQLVADHPTCESAYASGSGGTVTASNVPGNATDLAMTVPAGTATSALPSTAYNVCVYNGTSAGSVVIADTSTTPARYKINIYGLALSPTVGPSGGANIVTATVSLGTLTTDAAYYTQFQKATTTCTDTVLTTNTANTSATASGPTTLLITVPAGVAGAPADAYKVCVYAGSTGGSKLLAQGGTQYTLTAYGLGLSSYAIGVNAPNPTVIATMSSGSLPTTLAVEFQIQADGICNATYVTAADPPYAATTVNRVSSTRVVITVPAAVIAANNSFAVCIYEGTTGPDNDLVAGTALPYVVADPVGVTSVDVSAGPAQGGTTITVTGTFPATGLLTAEIGGEPLTIIARTPTSFTATVPAHTAGTFPITVTTVAGTMISQVAFTYSNGINVTPQTAPSLPAQTLIDVRGIGFSSLVFSDMTGTNQNGSGAHVYLVKGSYAPTALTSSATGKTNGQVAECITVGVVSDTELVCSLYLGGKSTGYARSLAGCTFTASAATLTTCTVPATAADVGFYITATSGGTGGGTVLAGATISAVSGATVTLSRAQPSTGGALAGAGVTLNSSRAVADVTAGTTTVGGVTVATLTSTTTASTSAAPFSTADIGHGVSGASIPPGTTVTAVAAGVATLSSALTGTAPTSVRLYVPTFNGASNGTYTITVVSTGAVAPTSYSASIISSGSTFTVAEYR
jgi:hypothetical protein